MATYKQFTKAVLTDAITQFFEAKGQRFSNLHRAKKNELVGLLKEHNISEEYVMEFKTKQKRKQELEEKQRNDDFEKFQKEQAQREHNFKINEALFTDTELSIIKDMYIKKYKELEVIYYEENKEAIDKDNERLERYKNHLRNNIGGEITDDGLIVNGVKVIVKDGMGFEFKELWQLENIADNDIRRVLQQPQTDPKTALMTMIDELKISGLSFR